MGNTLITYKQKLNLNNGFVININEFKRIYRAVEETIKNTSEYKKDISIYSSIEGETSAGDIKGQSFEDFLNEIITRQLELQSVRIYLSYSTYSKENPYSYTIDMYLGRAFGNQINLSGSDEKWVLDSKDKLEFTFSKVSLYPKAKKPLPTRLVDFIFNGKLVVTAWIMVIFSLLFSKFFPNIYYAWISSFIIAYALMGVATLALINQGDKTPIAKFMFVNKEKQATKKSIVDYAVKQPRIIQIILFIFALVGFISAIFTIIDIAKRYNWI
ncbi:MAG: hypothetical protein NTZ93_03175 [Candidatus Beckwithbacteria bacterium]|nr:hypothetical protein [Candidatus Beckwithbacteria bacterium]